MDFVRNESVVITTDGRRHTQELPATAPWTDGYVAQSVFDWERWWVFSTTTRGDSLISEAYSPVNTDKGRDRKSVV